MKKHKISYTELVKGGSFKSYTEECEHIKRLMEKGKISPIKSSGTNGKKPAMYKYFWIYEPEADYSGFIYELQYKLNQLINPEYYLNHPEVYGYERKFVLDLSRYLTENKDDLKIQLSENERSYAIWHLEKFLSGQVQNIKEHRVSAASILKHCGIDMKVLNVYHTYEPFSYYSKSKEIPQNILILENLDPFYSMRMKMMSGDAEIFGTDFSTLIYGSGKKVSSMFSGFELFSEDYLKDKNNRFFYFGDLDFEGIGIFESLYRKMEGIIEILPFKSAYNALTADYDIDELPESKELQNKNVGDVFWEFFTLEEKRKILDILESGKYIPQEKLSILNFS